MFECQPLAWNVFVIKIQKTEQKQKTMIPTINCHPSPSFLAHFPLDLKKLTYLRKYTKKCVTLRHDNQNGPKYCVLYTKSRPAWKRHTTTTKNMSYAERTSLQVAIVPLLVGDQSSETAAEYCSELADITTARKEYHLCKWKKNSFSLFPSIQRQNIARSESTPQEPWQKLIDWETNIRIHPSWARL